MRIEHNKRRVGKAKHRGQPTHVQNLGRNDRRDPRGSHSASRERCSRSSGHRHHATTLQPRHQPERRQGLSGNRGELQNRRLDQTYYGLPRPQMHRKQTRKPQSGTSALGHVWTAPGWQELSSRLQHWSVQPCVRPLDAVHMTAGHNALRGSGPGQKHAFDDALAQVGCPDRRIDRLCITCCSPSQPSHHAGCPARSRYAASATGSLYRSPFAIMAQAIRASLLASAMAATLVGRRASNDVSHGRCLVPWILA